jgi:toxin ParE1/3/4
LSGESALPRVIRSSLAKSDLIEIWFFIAKDSPDAADRFLALISEKCELIATSPEMGRRRDELAPGLRSFPVGRYLIFYRPIEDGIEVARVLSAYRDTGAFFN